MIWQYHKTIDRNQQVSHEQLSKIFPILSFKIPDYGIYTIKQTKKSFPYCQGKQTVFVWKLFYYGKACIYFVILVFHIELDTGPFLIKLKKKTDRPFTTRSQENIPERGRGLQKTWTSPEKLPFQAGGSRWRCFTTLQTHVVDTEYIFSEYRDAKCKHKKENKI